MLIVSSPYSYFTCVEIIFFPFFEYSKPNGLFVKHGGGKGSDVKSELSLKHIYIIYRKSVELEG